MAKIVNLEPYPGILDKHMKPSEMARLERVHSRRVLEHMLVRLTCPQCDVVYDGQGDRDKCMRWHRGEIL